MNKIKDWFDGGLFGLRRGYILLHPWKMFFHIKREIIWAWQRVFRGWDDRVVWSIDLWLADNIPAWIDELKNNKVGTPGCLFEEEDWEKPYYKMFPGVEEKRRQEWKEILGRISEGFRSYIALNEFKYQNEEEQKQLEDKFDEGFELFREWFSALWD